jgi:hypothetical protein
MRIGEPALNVEIMVDVREVFRCRNGERDKGTALGRLAEFLAADTVGLGGELLVVSRELSPVCERVPLGPHSGT